MWTDHELGPAEAWGELVRTLRRALGRWPIPLGVAVILTALAVVRRSANPPTYFASVVLRASEPEMVDLEEASDVARAGVATAPRTAARLVEYVKMVVFTDERLAGVLEKYDLSPGLRKRNLPLAVDNFRADLDVSVFQNDFILERRPGDPPRSARVEIGYWHPDPSVAFAIVDDLAELVISHEEIRRAEILEAARASTHQLVQMLEAEVTERNRQLNERLVVAAAQGTPSAAMALELAHLRSRITAIEQQLAEARRDEQEFATRGSMEQGALGMQFERIDFKAVERPPPKWRALLTTGISTFLIALPLAALLVGAFDGRLYHGEDVAHAGGRCVGLVRAWPDQARAARYARWRARALKEPRGAVES